MSGVSIVDSIAVLMIGLFSALATGGAVVAAQFIGRKDTKNANKAANQLVLSMGSMALLIMAIALIFNKQILQLIYEIRRSLLLGGKVMTQCIKKQGHYFANKGPSSQSCGFSSSHVWM